MLISVIISTYNKPEWLEKVLHGYMCQKDQDFEIVIADDGSGAATQLLIQRFKSENPARQFQHIWHEDDGFRKSAILNKAIQATRGGYLVFTDGDCIPRVDFISTHRRLARPGCYLSGGYFKLPMSTSEVIASEDISAGRAFQLPWLWQNGLKRSAKSFRLAAGPKTRALLDSIIPTKSTWNGNNSSAFKEDILRVNGHDERMSYGGQDVEMGYRLVHAGLRSIRVRYRALVLHLEHSRGYAHKVSIAKNLKIRQETLVERATWTDYGIVKRIEA